MTTTSPVTPPTKNSLRDLPRNVWAVSLTSFFMDISSEMVINIVPLFLANVLGVQTAIIGLIEGIAESTASLLKLFSGWLSDKLRGRKWLAVAGYGLSAVTKPFFYFAASWEAIAGIRWLDRVGKGIRTAPRDALVADSVNVEKRGLAFGFQRAADTAGAMLGLLIALGAVWLAQSNAVKLGLSTLPDDCVDQYYSGSPGRDSPGVRRAGCASPKERALPKFAFRSLGKPFVVFMVIVGLFELGNSSDAFLVLRAQDRGLSVIGILGMLVSFNLVYTLISAPAGSLSDRIGRRKLIAGGWLVYAVVYFGFGLARTGWQVWVLYMVYGLYYGMAYGTCKAIIADLVPDTVRGTAYGTYNAVIGILDFPASLIAGLLWQGWELGWAPQRHSCSDPWWLFWQPYC